MNDFTDGPLYNKKQSKLPSIIYSIIIAVALLLILTYYFIDLIQIDGDSMLNTVVDGQYVLSINHGYEIERNDVIIINVKDENTDKTIIKRVIGLEGDRILFVYTKNRENVDMYICKNGEAHFEYADEPYIKEQMSAKANTWIAMKNTTPVFKRLNYMTREYIESIDVLDENNPSYIQNIINSATLVPENGIFYLGDNRNISRDSRYYGFCKYSDVSSKVIKYLDVASFAEKFFLLLYLH